MFNTRKLRGPEGAIQDLCSLVFYLHVLLIKELGSWLMLSISYPGLQIHTCTDLWARYFSSPVSTVPFHHSSSPNSHSHNICTSLRFCPDSIQLQCRQLRSMLSTKNLRCFYTATTTKNYVTSFLVGSCLANNIRSGMWVVIG